VRARDTDCVGISEVEFLGSGPEDDDESEAEAASAAGSGVGSESADGTGTGSASEPPTAAGPDSEVEIGEAGYSAPRPLWYQRRVRVRRPSRPVAALLAALLVVTAAAAFAFARQSRAADDFSVTLISAQYTLPKDASGIDLALAVQNTGSTMVELTGVAVYQPGLTRVTQTGDVLGATEAEAGASTMSALGSGTAITPVAMPPKDVEVITVPFHYNCGTSTTPPTARSFSLAGFNARGTARTAQLALPLSVTPWQDGDIMRAAVCGLPTPESDLKIAYGGFGNTLMELTPVRFNYSILLTAPATTSVTVDSVSQDNPGISSSVDPGMPVVVLDGQTVRLTISWRVMSCVIATSVRSGDGVQITASANQTVQTWHATLGAQFTKDLDAEVSTVCSGT
jgi:hypothetical protein